MTSSAAPGFDAIQAEFFALIEREPELQSSLNAIAEEIEFTKTSVIDRNLSEWLTWLDGEGYDAQVVQNHSDGFAELLHNAGIGRNFKPETRTDELIQELKKVPNLLELLLSLLDHSSSLHAELIGTAGGTSLHRGQIVAQKLGVDRKSKAIREAAGEFAASYSASEMRETGKVSLDEMVPTSVFGSGQGQAAADRISTAREGRFMNETPYLYDR